MRREDDRDERREAQVKEQDGEDEEEEAFQYINIQGVRARPDQARPGQGISLERRANTKINRNCRLEFEHALLPP